MPLPLFDYAEESSFHIDPISNYFKGHGVPVISVTDSLKNYSPEELIVSRFDSHPSRKAHKIIAEEIGKYIK